MIDVAEFKDIKVKGRSRQSKFTNEVLKDFWICCVSREVSLLGRKEVLTGKAKFGILGDGKEVAQVAMARAFKKGDYRAGYYRDQTFMFALGLCTLEEYFAQLYADHDNDPFSGGRQMNCHFATPFVDEEGNWIDQSKAYNITSDVSCTGGQMARALGLALASKLYNKSEVLKGEKKFANNGKEVVFCTIGDASTSEGVFWETVNAAGVQKVPLAISVWDDGYGISVPIDLQTTKGSISEVLSGFELDEAGNGIRIYKGKGWDYPGLCALYDYGIKQIRDDSIPVLFHITEVTQPQGHSTSGSHERYKDADRLQWEVDMDCIKKMGEWMVENGLSTEKEILRIREKAKNYARECRDKAWANFCQPIQVELASLNEILENLISEGFDEVEDLHKELNRLINPQFGEVVQIGRRASYLLYGNDHSATADLKSWIDKNFQVADQRYHTHLYSSGKTSALNVPVIHPVFSEDSEKLSGYQVLNEYFDRLLEKDKRVLAFGEDVGHIGDVNQGFAGLQEKHGTARVFDTGIREWTIMGQAIGTAMRGLRPIAEIQYLDYLIYGLEPLSDDLATLLYRSNGLQKAPAIIRTRGHRLEGIWHAGSPLGMLINSLRGMYICVPRNMTQAAGMYNTLIQADDPGLVIECLNGYRLKEVRPDNLGEFTVPLGVPEILKDGDDVTLVTYGSCIRIALSGMELLEEAGVSVELIDAQTLLPFDLEGVIIQSLKKTNRIVFMDEDVPGGATAFMMKSIIEDHKGYEWLDSPPVTLTAQAHRPPYGSDGDYFSKPSPEDVFDTIYKVMNEVHPEDFPLI